MMDVYYQTDQGQRRKNNEDAVGVFWNKVKIPLGIVADGMGGHQAGDVASQLLIDTLGKSWQLTQIDSKRAAEAWVSCELLNINQLIYEQGMQDEERSGMGTTVVLSVALGEDLLIAHVGDSRAYLYQNNELHLVTEDHSLVNELVKRGEITEEEALVHPRKSVLVRSIGMPGLVQVDVNWYQWQAYDQLLLCSDGLTNMVSFEEISHILSLSDTLSYKASQLVSQANKAGGLDNITLLLWQKKTDGLESEVNDCD